MNTVLVSRKNFLNDFQWKYFLHQCGICKNPDEKSNIISVNLQVKVTCIESKIRD